MKKVLTVFLVVMMIVSSTFISSSAVQMDTTKEVNENQLDKYLIEVGFPEDLVDKFKLHEKRTYYDEKLTYGGTETTYGILTEDVEIPLVKDSNDELILANENDKDKLEKLLKDKEKVDKILKHNKKERNADGSVSINSLANWTAYLTSSTPSYEADGKVRVYLSYNWDWNYDVYYTMIDKMAFAWSDDWDAEYSTAYYWYQAFGSHVNYGTDYYTDYGYKYDEYAPGTGIAIAYDIVGYWNRTRNGLLVTYNALSQEGSASLFISKYRQYTGTNEQTSAVARYFHKEGTFTGTVTFGASPSLGITYSTSYDQSPDSAKLFTWSN